LTEKMTRKNLDNQMSKLTGGKKPYIIACIPAYNEENTIAKVILKAKKYAMRGQQT